MIPATPDGQLPVAAKAGVTCDVCHQISALTGAAGRWKEPANASFAIQQGMVKYGNYGNIAENRSHSGEKRDFFAASEFCASCHTVIQPMNGFHIEATYDEWKAGIYSRKGIQCQDCHMRTVEEAQKVAETLQPVVLPGKSVAGGADRPIYRHYFVGGNANADILANGKTHGRMAEARLKGAARLELKSPSTATAGKELLLEVVVRNVAAGHGIPTAVTELRRMWVNLQVRDAHGKLLFQNPGLDQRGHPQPGAIAFGAIAGNRAGKPTFKPWEMTQFLWKRTIPPKGFAQDTVRCTLPAGAAGPLTVEARLFYQSAPRRWLLKSWGKMPSYRRSSKWRRRGQPWISGNGGESNPVLSTTPVMPFHHARRNVRYQAAGMIPTKSRVGGNMIGSYQPPRPAVPSGRVSARPGGRAETQSPSGVSLAAKAGSKRTYRPSAGRGTGVRYQ